MAHALLEFPIDAAVQHFVQAQPERIQKIVRLILAHSDAICAVETGMIELHYHDKSVTAKHTVRWVE